MSRHLQYHYGQKTPEGKLKAESFRDAFAALPPGPIRLLVEADNPKRTPPQAGLIYHAFTTLAKALNDAGYVGAKPWTKDSLKNYIKFEAKLYPMEERVLPTGVVVEQPRSTADLDIPEASAVIDRIQEHFATEFGMVFPRRGEQATMDL